MCGSPLCVGLNVLLHIAVIFTMHRRNVVVFHTNFCFIKVFKGNNYCPFFHTDFCLSTLPSNDKIRYVQML